MRICQSCGQRFTEVGRFYKREGIRTMKCRLLILMVLLGGMCSVVHADDSNPPTLWQRGEPGSTYQQWEFLSDDLTPVPDFLDNPWA